MLWALLAYYFFGGFGGASALGHFYNDQAQSLIKAEVEDSRRRDNAQVFAGMVKKGINTFLKQTDQSGKKTKKLYQDCSSTPAFDALIQEGLDEQRQTVSDILQSRQALVRAVTPGEWSAIIAAAKRQDDAAAAKAAEKAAKKAPKQAAPT